MKFNISNIIKNNGASLNIEFCEVLTGFESVEGEYEFGSPVIFKGMVVNDSGNMKLNGHLCTEYTVVCYRCLKEITKEMCIEIKEDFIKKTDETDNEAYTYDNNCIEIDKVLMDNIILGLPMKQICREECKGLCLKCGSDLNEKDCNCCEDVVSPRMEALKKYFNN